MKKYKFIALGSLALLGLFTLSACTSKQPAPVEQSQYMDRPASDGKYYYNNELYAFAVVLPAEFEYYQTQRREYTDYADIEFYVPTNDRDFYQEVSGYGKIMTVRMYNKEFWEKIKNDEDFSMYQEVAQKDNYIYTISFWPSEPSDWRDKLNDELKQEIVQSFSLK